MSLGKLIVNVIFFFKQKTAYEMCGRDWSSDVCSSDLAVAVILLIIAVIVIVRIRITHVLR